MKTASVAKYFAADLPPEKLLHTLQLFALGVRDEVLDPFSLPSYDLSAAEAQEVLRRDSYVAMAGHRPLCVDFTPNLNGDIDLSAYDAFHGAGMGEMAIAVLRAVLRRNG